MNHGFIVLFRGAQQSQFVATMCKTFSQPLVKVRLILVICLVAVMLCACSRNQEVVVIGYAPALREVTMLAEEDFKETNLSSDIKIVVKGGPAGRGDVGSEIQIATTMSKWNDIIGVVGHASSGQSLACAPIYNEAGIPQLIPTATNKRLRQAGPWTLMLSPDDSSEGAFMVGFMDNYLHARSALLLYQPDDYCVGLAEGITDALRSSKIALLEKILFDDSTNAEIIIKTSLKHGIPDIVVLAANNPWIGVMARNYQAQIPGMRFLTGDALSNISSLKDAGATVSDSMYFVSFWYEGVRNPLSQQFVDRFKKSFNRLPDVFAAKSYDAISLLAAAVREVGTNRENIRRYLSNVGSSTPAYAGVTGLISFSDQNRQQMFILHLSNGNPTVVWSKHAEQ